MIIFDHLSFNYDAGNPVLKDISLNVKEGESVGLIGSNGAGKTTLMKMIPGLLFPETGSVSFMDMAVEKKNLPAIRKMAGYVFQDSDSQLFMATAYDDVAFGPRNYGLTEDEVEKCVMAAMERCSCAHLKDKPIYKMSGGEKKLVSLATVLSLTPSCLLLDEPSAALDPGNRRHLINLLNDLGITMILASHDLDMIWDTCSRTILLNKGRLIADGPTKDILQDKVLLESHNLELPLRFANR